MPPVIIVTSLALIIFLIFRKSLEIEKQILKNKKKENGNKLVVSVKAKGLRILEKISHWFKIFSLKFHNWNENKLKILKKKKTETEIAEEKIAEEEMKSKKRIIPVIRKIDIQVNKKERKKMQYYKKAEEKEKNNVRKIMFRKKIVRPDDTRKELEEILIERIATDPRDIEAYERLGDCYISQNNYKDAQECYRQVLKLNPQSLTVKSKLNRLNK